MWNFPGFISAIIVFGASFSSLVYLIRKILGNKTKSKHPNEENNRHKKCINTIHSNNITKMLAFMRCKIWRPLMRCFPLKWISFVFGTRSRNIWHLRDSLRAWYNRYSSSFPSLFFFFKVNRLLFFAPASYAQGSIFFVRSE